ncbi:GH39 family glycosyl hydrolase [Cerasicoccus fimbriatus]|uniref:GH39 family glycosyl hydrolase n=1 Tax=Cerasicoccus fimbriatus TaxID=3014554 RepID=UPI0022B56C1C|nr:glycoside hydrolase family 44 protein [Cerasicoccus sp. TK19100]
MTNKSQAPLAIKTVSKFKIASTLQISRQHQHPICATRKKSADYHGLAKHCALSIVFLALFIFAAPLKGRVPDVLSETDTARSLELVVDFSKPAGQFRALHGVNNGPVNTYGGPDLTQFFIEAGIPSCRLHDVPHSGSYAVDIPTIFPLAHADPDDPLNYNFERTDDYIQGVLDAGAKVVFRLGTSIEHSPRKYNVHPPEDYDRWARVCVNIIRHYNEGWANGFHHDIQHWEIWNEPDLSSATWTGTPEEYYKLYAVTAKAIKQHDPGLKVGGPALAKNKSFLKDFLAACREQEAPLDFMSWHLYTSNPNAVAESARDMREILDEQGFTETTTDLNEWHYFNGDWKRLRSEPGYAKSLFEDLNGAPGAAFIAATLMTLQDQPVDAAHYYTGDMSRWGLFSPAGTPNTTYFAFKAFNELLKTPNRITCSINGEANNLFAESGVSEDGETAQILISNVGPKAVDLYIQLQNHSGKEPLNLEIYAVDTEHRFTRLSREVLPPGTEKIEVNCPSQGIRLIRLEPI